MGFPLGDWIDSHASVRHNLGQSGMGPQLTRVARALRRPMAPDVSALRRELARAVGVPPARLFLTHGASEGNSLVLHFLAHELRSRATGPPTVGFRLPEYPPILDVASLAGYRPQSARRRADVTVLSDPNNPTGRVCGDEEFADRRGDSRWVLVDETFREFTPRRSRAPRGEAGVWTTGTFTKAYGGDPVRVGFVTAPTEAVDPFAAYHALVTDGLADASVSAARALLRDRTAILDETRRIFLRNRALLERGLPEVLPVHAPVCFDPIQNSDGTRFARGMLRRSILVCPGHFFGVPDGVRLCLTRRSFPADLAAYTAARAHWLRRR